MDITSFIPPDWTPELVAFAKWVHNQHGDQKRKYTGFPYAVHLLRVANRVWVQTGDRVLTAAALGHDLLEDTPTTKTAILDQLTQLGFPERERKEVLRLIVELTDVYEKKDYPDLNRRERKRREAERLSNISENGKRIKRADVADNRYSFQRYDRHFLKVFEREVKQFLKH